MILDAIIVSVYFAIIVILLALAVIKTCEKHKDKIVWDYRRDDRWLDEVEK